MIQLLFTNSTDWVDKVWQNYTEELWLNDRSGYDITYKGKKERLITKDDRGKLMINKVYVYDEYELSFVADIDALLFLTRIRLLDGFTINNGETITPDEWDARKGLINGNNEQFGSITITYRLNFVEKSNKDTNNDVELNTVPYATNVDIVGILEVGNTATLEYTYNDDDGDLEGASVHSFYRADNSSGLNKQLIATGLTPHTYVIQSADEGKYIIGEITPIALTGETTGLTVDTGYIEIPLTNQAPFATDLLIPTPLVEEVQQTAEYIYNDVDGDLEGTSVYRWSIADDINGLNESYIGGEVQIHIIPDAGTAGKYLSFHVQPIALTGITDGEWVQSDFKVIT